MGTLVNRRRVMGGGAAPLTYDAEVEYVQANGSQRFITPFHPNRTYSYEAKFGCDAITKRTFLLGVDGAGANYMAINSSGNLEGNTTVSFVNAIRTLNISPTSLIIDGNIYNGRPGVFSTTSRFFTILSCQQDKSNSGSDIRLYYFVVKINGEIAYDYIPVRIGTTGYLYDRVSGTLLGNGGTGDFVLGPDKT